MDHKEKLYQSAADARLIHLNEQLIFPLLQTKLDERLASLCEALKFEGTVKMADVAYIAAVRDIMLELKAKAGQGDRATDKLNMYPQL